MTTMKMCPVTWIAQILLIIGGLNWGLTGIGGFAKSNLNVVNLLLGQWPTVEWIVYILVGLSALWMIYKCFTCKSDKTMISA